VLIGEVLAFVVVWVVMVPAAAEFQGGGSILGAAPSRRIDAKDEAVRIDPRAIWLAVARLVEDRHR
jgi:hypothetical protein